MEKQHIICYSMLRCDSILLGLSAVIDLQEDLRNSLRPYLLQLFVGKFELSGFQEDPAVLACSTLDILRLTYKYKRSITTHAASYLNVGRQADAKPNVL